MKIHKIFTVNIKNRKIFIKVSIIILSVISLLAITIAFVTGIRNKKISDRLNNGISKEIEYQVGNYVNGGLYVNGYTYMITGAYYNGYYDEEGNWISQPYTVMYRIDSQGKCEEFYTFKDNMGVPAGKAYIYYYDGWFYFQAEDMHEAYGTGHKVFRISEEEKNIEVVYKDEENFLQIGIRDGLLIMTDENSVYVIDLTKEVDFNNKDQENTLQAFSVLSHNAFFGYCIYNARDTYGVFEEEREFSARQYYDGNCYTLCNNDGYSGVEAYENGLLVRRLYEEGEYVTDEIVHTDVLCFNIFNDKLYYMVCVGDDNELRCSDLDGSNEEVLYRTDFDEKLYCKNMVVSEDNIICDFGPGTDSFITDRCIIDMQLEYVNYMSFEDEIKGLNN